MKKKMSYFFTICCIAAAITCGAVFGSGTSLAATNGKTARQSASAGNGAAEDVKDTENDAADDGNSGEEAASSEDELVIMEVQDTETPAANVQVAQEQPTYLVPMVCLAVAAAALLAAVVVLQIRYGRLKQQTRRLEDEIAQLYAKNM